MGHLQNSLTSLDTAAKQKKAGNLWNIEDLESLELRPEINLPTGRRAQS
jgi:hypothetical protein